MEELPPTHPTSSTECKWGVRSGPWPVTGSRQDTERSPVQLAVSHTARRTIIRNYCSKQILQNSAPMIPASAGSKKQGGPIILDHVNVFQGSMSTPDQRLQTRRQEEVAGRIPAINHINQGPAGTQLLLPSSEAGDSKYCDNCTFTCRGL